MTSVWAIAEGHDLGQGNFLPDCWIPLVRPDFATQDVEEEVAVESRDLIIVTQSYDLTNEKNHLAALCPIYTLDCWEENNENFKKKGIWENVRRGRHEGLHLLASPEEPRNNRQALVVDFRQIFSLPVAYLKRHADQVSHRWRLQSPYLEHFSQAFARFFMRVGLPVDLPPFK